MPSKPSTHTGMGAIPYNNGVAFRVWAPNADSVAVAGSFNNWNPNQFKLASEGNGYWSIDISDCKPGDEYDFILTHHGEVKWRIDPYARDVTSSIGHAVIHKPEYQWQTKHYHTPPWHKMVIYELHIGTFNDKPGGPPGNIDSVIARLSYLRDLGINVIQLMPPAEFAGGFSWGYNPANIFAVEHDYGNAYAMKRLIDKAHQHGIGVIIDVVYNHFGPGDLSIWQFDGWSENDKGGIYFYNDWRSATPWGDTRPNYGRPEVRQYLKDNAMMWLDEYQADGLRWDATYCIRNVYGSDTNEAGNLADGWSLMRWINDEINKQFPWKISIAEDMRENSYITRSTEKGGAGFDSQWSASFVHTVRDTIIKEFDYDRDMNHLTEVVQQKFNGNALERVIYTESHDEVANGHERVPEEIWPGNAQSWFSKKRSILGAILVFTSPGIPMIFQGQEFLEDGWFSDTDPLDLIKLNKFSGITQLYKDLIALRKNSSGISEGLSGQNIEVFHINNKDKLLGFHRWDKGGAGDDVVVFLNFSNRAYFDYTIGFPHAGRWSLKINSDARVYDSSFSNAYASDVYATARAYDGLQACSSVQIAPYSGLIWART